MSSAQKGPIGMIFSDKLAAEEARFGKQCVLELMFTTEHDNVRR